MYDVSTIQLLALVGINTCKVIDGEVREGIHLTLHLGLPQQTRPLNICHLG